MSAPILVDRQRAPGGGGGSASSTTGGDVAPHATGVAGGCDSPPSPCGNKLISVAVAPTAPVSQVNSTEESPSFSRIGAGVDAPQSLLHDRKMQQQQRLLSGCDKNKQHNDNCDAQEASDIKPAVDNDSATATEAAVAGRHIRDSSVDKDEGLTGEGHGESTTTQLQRFKLPNPISSQTSTQEATHCSTSGGGSATAPILGLGNMEPLMATSSSATRHHSTVERSGNMPAGGRMLKRKTSVFSHGGFMGLHKLDQSAIKQHHHATAAAAAAAAATATATATATVVVPSVAAICTSSSDGCSGVLADTQQQQQVINSNNKSKTQQPQDQQAAPAPASASPRQPYRSDTLGSTGSSRASSCDEPTIVSGASSASTSSKSLAPPATVQREHASDMLKSTGKNLIPNSQDVRREGDQLATGDDAADDDEAAPTMMQCDTDDSNAQENDAKNLRRNRQQHQQLQQDTGSSDEEDEEEDEDEEEEEDEDEDDAPGGGGSDTQRERQQRVSLSTNFRDSLKIPPFESIKTQIKKNSIPNAEDIRRHIEKLISRNEEIIENWNQVSIRSYNSSAAATAAAAASSSLTSPVASNGNKRPSKRWSTTALCTKGSSIVLNQTPSTFEVATSGPQKPMSGIERKRSQIHPVRRVSLQKQQQQQQQPQQQTSNLLCSQQQQQSTTNMLPSPSGGTCQPLASPTQQISSSLSMPSSPKQQQAPNPFASDVERFLLQSNFARDAHIEQQQPSHQHHTHPLNTLHHNQQQQQTIESAIENLSLKKTSRVENEHQAILAGQLDQLGHPASSNRDDIVVAALLVERQRQQQLLEDYLRQRAAADHQQSALNYQHQQAPQIPLPHPSLLDQYQQQQQQQLLEHQLGLSRLAVLENELQLQQRQQAMATSLMNASLQNQHQLPPTNAADPLLHQFHCADAHQRSALESQLLNEYLAKMIIARQQQQQQQEHVARKPQPLELSKLTAAAGSPTDHGGRPLTQPFQVSPTSPSRVYLGHGTELQTQSLDSANPSYRCEACDISFWTRDLLNYHSMTSCSARTGPRPSKPMAFSFNQPNGFDKAHVPHTSASSTRANGLQSPTVVVSCADTGQQQVPSSSTSTASTPYHNHHHHQHQPLGPSRRRTYDELNAPSSSYMATYRDLLMRSHQDREQEQHQQQQHQEHHNHPQRQLSTSSILDYRQLREFQELQQQQLLNQQQSTLGPPGRSGSLAVPPKSPHKTRESAELAWQQRLDELSILKQQLLISGAGGAGHLDGSDPELLHLHQRAQQQQQQQQSMMVSESHLESKLPIKKRKISEPNMKY